MKEIIFTSWDHDMDDKIVASHNDLVEFLLDMEMEYEELNELDA